MADTYRPSRRPARDRPPPLADRMTRSGESDNYRPAEQQRRPQNGDRNVPSSDFTYSSGQHAQFAPSGPSDFSGRGARRNRTRGGAAGPNNDHNARRGGDSMPSHAGGRANGNGFRRGGFRKAAPHQRALLQSRDDTTEHALGLSGPNKFRSLEDISDDEEADMEIDSDQSDEDGQSGKAKIARVTSTVRDDGNSVPRWSNPDPYTVLPPPEETTGKRTDVVKLIRKAKNEVDGQADATNAVAANDDFISFDDEDDDDQALMEDEAPPLAPWHHASFERQPVMGSLNDMSSTGTMSTLGRVAKRTAEEPAFPVLPQRPSKLLKRRRGDDLDGGIVEQWLPRFSSASTPWATEPVNMHVRHEPYKWLHNEILDFYDYVAPGQHENTVRQQLVDRIRATLGSRQFAPTTGRIECFGSFPAGLYLPHADMDLVYASDEHLRGGRKVIATTKNKLYKIARLLESRGITNDFQVIAQARVPIIKFEDRLTRLPVDISFENVGGLDAKKFFTDWSRDYPDMVYLVALVKQFLLMRGLNEVNTGGLGGFSVICLVVSFIQLQPKPKDLGHLFLNFLDYYGRFDLGQYRIVMDPPRLVEKVKNQPGIDGRFDNADTLSIQDPGKPDNNISGGSYKVRVVFQAFADAHGDLSDEIAAIENGTFTGNSILEPIMGGNYTVYEQHRKHMQTLQ